MTTQQWIETLNRLYLNDTGAYLTWTLRRAEDTAQAYRTATTELQDALNTMQAQFPAEYFDIIRAAQSFTPEPLTPADVSWDDGDAPMVRAPLHTGYAYCTQAEYDRLTTEPHEDDTCYCHLPQCDGAHRDGQLRMNRAGSWVATPEPHEDDVLGLTCLSCGRTIGIDDARANSTCIHCTPEPPEDDTQRPRWLARLNTVAETHEDDEPDIDEDGTDYRSNEHVYDHFDGLYHRAKNIAALCVKDEDELRQVFGFPARRDTSSMPAVMAKIQEIAKAAGLATVLLLSVSTPTHAAPITLPAGCTIVGSVPGDEAFPLAHCSDGAYLYADMDGSATHDRGAWVDAAGYIFFVTR